ncbi:MAG: penicillin-binding protein activator [Smithella sp.]
MNRRRTLSKMFILIVVFFLAFGETVIAAESSPPAALQTKAKKKVQPAAIRQQEQNHAESQIVAGLPERNTIGCVLPLTGRYGEYGTKALDAILLAAGIFDKKNKTPWKIVAEDSQMLSTGVKDAVARLSNTGNVIAIIAVAGTEEAFDAAREAAKQKVPLIMITSKEGITNDNEYVFQHFLTPSQEIRALAKYAVDDLNCETFSILYPEDEYGTRMTKIFCTEIGRLGGKVEGAIPFSKKQTDFREEISKVIMNDVNETGNIDAGNPETKAQVPIEFKALFIPDSYQRAKLIASQISAYAAKGFALLGTSLWNSSNLLKKDAACLEGAVFADSFVINGISPEINDFVDTYYAAYSREPENIEALTYDTMGIIIRVLDDKNVLTRKQFMAGLQQVKNYKGATGETSFSEDRVSQKTALILQVRNGKIEQVK